MKINLDPITCGKCGSAKVVNPVNDPSVDLLCEVCGHTKASEWYRQRLAEHEGRKWQDHMQSVSNQPPKRTF